MLLRFTRSPKRRKRRRSPIDWIDAADIASRVRELLTDGDFDHVNPKRVVCYRSTNAATRAYARIWGLGRIWQQALNLAPAYVIEVVSEKFDRLPHDEQDMVLIHELLHIPKTFSGALVPHKHKGGVNDRTVREVFAQIKRKKY